MCGLVGFIATKATKNDLKFFRTLLFLNVLRGNDGTGVIKLNKHKDKSPIMEFDKTASNAIEFMHTNNDVLSHSPSTKGWLGHCRAATVGDIDPQNSHPFEFPSLVGMHNGTINQNYPNKREYKTDTEALYHEIDKFGIEKAIQNFHHTYGAWALVYYNKHEECVSFTRNQKRPLFCVYTEDQTGLAYSSDKGFLEMALQQNQIEHDEIWSLKEDLLFSIYLTDDAAFSKENTRVTPYKAFIPITHKNNYHNPRPNTHTRVDNTPKPTKKPLDILASARKYFDFYFDDYCAPVEEVQFDLYVGPHNSLLEAAEYEKLLKRGCNVCLEPDTLDDYLEYGLIPEVVWLPDGNYICNECKELNVVQEMLPPHLRNEVTHEKEEPKPIIVRPWN